MSQILIHGDSTQLFAPEACQAFDVLLTDPPYSAHTHENAVSCWAKGEAAKGAVARDFGFDPLTDSLRRYLASVAASVRRWSIMYSDLESAEQLMQGIEVAGGERIRQIPWIRWSMPQLSADRPPQGAEMLVIAHAQDIGPQGGRKPRSKAWNGPGWLTHLEHACLRGRNKHPTEKPLDQALDLVHWFSRPGEAVFDPCAGSGVVGVACALLGRTYVGCELQPEHATAAQARIAEAQAYRLSDRDSDRLARWVAGIEERIAKASGILAGDQAKQAGWTAANPGEPLPKRLTGSVQNVRCLDAMRIDMLHVAPWRSSP